ncbi:MAG: hypothetical protein AB1815_10040 [Bacillota bacterium]|jgi:Tfp pilus assembly protein PilN
MYDFNLLPRRLRPGLSGVDLNHLAFLGAVVVVLGLALTSLLGLTFRAHVLEMQAQELGRQLQALGPAVEAAEKVALERERYQALNADYRAWINRRQEWPVILGEINSLIPADIWLTEIKTTRHEPREDSMATGENVLDSEIVPEITTTASAVLICGKSWDLASVEMFVHNLYRLPGVQKVQLHHIRGAKNGELGFSLTAYLKGDAGR